MKLQFFGPKFYFGVIVNSHTTVALETFAKFFIPLISQVHILTCMSVDTFKNMNLVKGSLYSLAIMTFFWLLRGCKGIVCFLILMTLASAMDTMGDVSITRWTTLCVHTHFVEVPSSPCSLIKIGP